MKNFKQFMNESEEIHKLQCVKAGRVVVNDSDSDDYSTEANLGDIIEVTKQTNYWLMGFIEGAKEKTLVAVSRDNIDSSEHDENFAMWKKV